MFKRILVPLDGSERAEHAIPVAARIARLSAGSIVFVRVVLPPVEFGTYGVDHLVALKPGAFETRAAKATDYLTEVVTTYATDLEGFGVSLANVDTVCFPLWEAIPQDAACHCPSDNQ